MGGLPHCRRKRRKESLAALPLLSGPSPVLRSLQFEHSHNARASVRQRKTGRPVCFEITEQTRQAIDDHLSHRSEASSPYLFPGRGPAGHLTARQYARLLGKWLTMIGLDASFYGMHSLRRTKATLIYKKTGNLRVVQLLLGHTKVESTVRDLGIEVDDALAVAEQIDV